MAYPDLDYNLTEEQTTMRDTVRRFGREVIRPGGIDAGMGLLQESDRSRDVGRGARRAAEVDGDAPGGGRFEVLRRGDEIEIRVGVGVTRDGALPPEAVIT